MQIAICDVDQAERNLLRTYLNALRPEAPVAEFECGEDLLGAYRTGEPFDLVFLDIYLGGINGMEAASILRRLDRHVSLVFLTTTRDFAVESYDVSALSYLVKPLDIARLSTVLERFDAVWRPRCLFINDRFFVADDIVSAESKNKQVVFTFSNKARATINAKLGDVEAQLKSRNFLRCHRSFIVNMDHISHLADNSFITVTGDTVLIRQKSYTALRKRYFEYITSL